MNPATAARRDLGGYYALVAYSFRNFRALAIAPVRLVFLRQVYYTGIEAFAIISLIALLSGALLITQIISLMGANSELALRTLVWVVVREMGPLFVIIYISKML